jgi:hypothetical protein
MGGKAEGSMVKVGEGKGLVSPLHSLLSSPASFSGANPNLQAQGASLLASLACFRASVLRYLLVLNLNHQTHQIWAPAAFQCVRAGLQEERGHIISEHPWPAMGFLSFSHLGPAAGH